MSFLDRLFTWTGLAPEAGLTLPKVNALSESAEYFDLSDPNLTDFLRGGRLSSAGVQVTDRVALGNSTLFRATTLICSSMGMLPFRLLERLEGGGFEVAREHPVNRLLHSRPNRWQTPSEFKALMQRWGLWEGVGYARILRSPINGVPLQLIPLHPKYITWSQNSDWTLVFHYRGPKGQSLDIPQADMLRVRAPLSDDGVTGEKLLVVAAEALGLSRAAEKSAGNVFKNGAMVGGVLEHPKTLSPEAVDRLRTQFQERSAGSENQHKWVVAEDGMKVVIPSSSARDSQMTEARKHQVEEVARFTGVPRPLLMVDETSWGSGIEQLGLFFITYCLGPWFVAWEEAVSRSLLTEDEQTKYVPKFNEAALLRGSLKDQSEFFSKALGSGGSPAFFTADEVRDKLNMNPKGGTAAELAPGSSQVSATPAPPAKEE